MKEYENMQETAYKNYGDNNVDDVANESASDTDVDFDLGEEGHGSGDSGADITSVDGRVGDTICKK